MAVDITTVGTRLILGECDEKGLENARTIIPLQDYKVSKRIRGADARRQTQKNICSPCVLVEWSA